jgi:hypothetical protein
MAMAAAGKLTVLYGEGPDAEILPRSVTEESSVNFVTEPDLSELALARRLLVITSATRLSDFAPFITRANSANRLQALLVRTDVEPEWVPFMLHRAGLRTLRNTLVHSGGALPARMLRALASDLHHDSIATATVIQDLLIVINCALEAFEIGFDELPALKRIPGELRSRFEIDEEGVFIHWPVPDVHLGLDDIRLVRDPRRKARARALKAAHDTAFGVAVRKLRQFRELRQTDVPGLSARHIRRIETGYVPGEEAIDALAAAHGMDPDDYLNELSELMDDE